MDELEAAAAFMDRLTATTGTHDHQFARTIETSKHIRTIANVCQQFVECRCGATAWQSKFGPEPTYTDITEPKPAANAQLTGNPTAE